MSTRARSLRVAVYSLAVVAAYGLIRSLVPSSAPPPSERPAWAVEEIASTVRGGHPVIFLGLDGADWHLLDEYIARGLMPNLQHLVETGTSGRLQTQPPALSPLVWTTMMTGVGPLDHGILDFVQFHPTTGLKEPIGSTQRRVPAIWNMVDAAGKTSSVFGLWATYPAESVHGLMVSDRLFTFLFKEQSPPEGIVFPATEEAWARDALTRAEAGTDYRALQAYLPWLSEAEYRQVAESDNPYGNPISALRRILVETSVYRTLSLDWIARQRPDLAVVYLQGTDTIGHVFAPYVPPQQPEVNARDYARYQRVPEQYFHALDAVIGEYAAIADRTGAVLMLASDHGFLWDEGRPTTLSSVATATAARWHASEGIYLVHGPGIPASLGHGATGGIEQVCATLLALLGLPPGRDVNGDPLAGAQPTGAPRVDYFGHFQPPSASTAARPDSGVNSEALANLRSLGYIGSGESTAAPESARGSTRSAGSYNNEGLIQRSRDRIPQAIEAFERAIALDPNLASAQWNLSDLLFSRGTDLDRADRLLEQAFAGGLPEGNRYLIGRAIAYQRNGQLSRSLALLDAALTVQSGDAELWLFRGRYRVESSNCAGAARDFSRAASLAPANPAVYASLGLALMCQDDRPGARRAFAQSLHLDPNQPKIREFLAKVGG